MGWGSIGSAWNSIQNGANNLWEFDQNLYGAILNPSGLGGIGGLSGLTGSNSPKVDTASTLTAEQQRQLAALTNQNISNYQPMFSTLGSLAYNPQTTYSKLNNWENEFQSGVVNPALSQMNTAIDNTKHSSNLHSSANRLAQDKIRQNTLNDLAAKRYNQMMTERSMEMQAAENALQNQLSALGALGNLSGQALGVNGVENIATKNPTILDYATAGGSLLGGLGALI